MRKLLLSLALFTAPAAYAPAAYAQAGAGADTKYDIGTVRTIDTTRGTLICDMPDGQVTYDVSQAQAFDFEGKPIGAASSALHPGDKVRLTYVIANGAHVSEVRLWK